MSGQNDLNGRLGENARDRWAETIKRRSPMADAWCRRLVLASPILAAHLLLIGPPQPPFHGRFLYGNVHLEWDKILTTEKRFVVLAPRGIGKSEVFSFAYPIWQMICNRWTSGLTISSTYDNAKRVLQHIRDQIEENPLLRWLYPARRASRQWNNQAITLSNGHHFIARSCGSKMRGLHPGYIICDDLLSDEAKTSELVRRKTARFYFSVVEQLPLPEGQLGVVGTPMAASDLVYHDLRVNPSYKHFSFPILDAKQRSIWPELFPEEFIEHKKATLPSQVFTTEMMVTPVSDETSMLPRALLQGDPQEQWTSRLAMPAAELAALGINCYAGVDLAFSASADADYFVIFVIGLDAQENHWIIDIYRERGVPYNQQFALVNEYGRKYHCRRINVEANQAQSILGNELIRNTSLPVKKYVMTAKKHDLISGFPMLRRLAENGKWRVPRGDANSVEKTNTWYDELESFTFIGGKVVSVGQHDDTVAACYLACEAAKAGSSFRFGSSTSRVQPKPLPGIAAAPGPNAGLTGQGNAYSGVVVQPPWRRS